MRRMRLRRARRKKGLSQEALAEALETTQVTISQWESGEVFPSPYFVSKLLAFFGVDDPAVLDIVFDDEEESLVTISTREEMHESTTSTAESSRQKEENKGMNPQRRGMFQWGIGLAGAGLLMPATEQLDLIAEVRGVLYPSVSGPADKELKYLEQRMRYYWLDRQNVSIGPADLILHVRAYVREVLTLLDRSLLPSVRTRLCACLSQGMLLIGHNLDGMGQFQTARTYYQTAIESAHEANHNILQALAWYRNSRSWAYSDSRDHYKQALDSMFKACHFASLESDLAVQCVTQVGLAEVYAYLKEKNACLDALKNAGKLDGYGSGDWYFIHLFDPASINGYRGSCLQRFYQPDNPATHPLLEEARQALETVLSQPNTSVLRRAFCTADMAQVYAREGNVDSACDSAKQIMNIVDTNASLRQSLLAVRAHLEPYADVAAVKELDTQIRELCLAV